MKTFKSMRKTGEVKRGEAAAVRPSDLHEEPGFNLRDLTALDHEGQTFEQGIEDFARYIKAGGVYPPLEVRPREEGGVWIVEGHRRRLAILRAIEQGAPIEWVNVIPFTGNDAERTLRVITSARRADLSPVEVARGYKRLIAFGWTPDAIAAGALKSRSHVDQLLMLADAPSAVQRQVLAREVSVSLALDSLRKHGEGAADVLADKLGEAKAAGKAKVTRSVLNGKALPKKVVSAAISGLAAFVASLPKEARERLASIEGAVKAGTLPEGQEVSVPAAQLLALLESHHAIEEARGLQAKRAREKASKAAQVPIEGANDAG